MLDRTARPARGLSRAVLLFVCAAILAQVMSLWSSAPPAHAQAGVGVTPPSQVLYLPFVGGSHTCQPVPSESYSAIWVLPPPTDPPASEHPDLNLALRGYAPTDAYLGLVDYGGATDPNLPPQLPGLFPDNRTGVFLSVHQVYDWDWQHDKRGQLLTNPEVTLAGLATTPGETIHVPPSSYDIGQGFQVLVLYATPERITLKYTREDNVVHGYTLHLEGICVEPRLLALYEAWNAAGREYLPVLASGQALGRAQSAELRVAIRDSGSFLDPRSRKDWWRGR